MQEQQEQQDQQQERRAGREVRSVDPRTLLVRSNVRAAAQPDPELVASVRTNGVLQPPLVYADGDDLVIVAGHRRVAAAVAAGLDRVEVLVGPQMPEPGRLGAQVSENVNRRPLTAAEVADAVEQMALLGVPAGQIAKAAGLRKAQVEAARAVAAAGRAVKESIHAAPGLTLDQAAVLAQWGDDPDAVQGLLDAAGKGGAAFEHRRALLEDKRRTAETFAAAAAEWQRKGYVVLNPAGEHIGLLPDGAAYTHDLVDDAGRTAGSFTGVSEALAAMAVLDGKRAVVLSPWDPRRATEVCLDPAAAGLKKRTAASGRGTGPAAEAAREERARVIANNKLWKVAAGVREAHVAAFIRAGTFSPELVAAMHRRVVALPAQIAEEWKRKLFYTLLEFPGSGVSRSEKNGLVRTEFDPAAPANRVAGQLLAALADGAERDLAGTTWRTPNRAAADWLALLVEHTGYSLADIEAVAVKAAHPGRRPPGNTAAGRHGGTAAEGKPAQKAAPPARRTAGGGAKRAAR